jgi:micrococcal nuclease
LFVLGIAGLGLAVFFGSPPAGAHGGGLDGCGGHNDRKRGGYHVHNHALYCQCYPEADGCAPDKDATPSAASPRLDVPPPPSVKRTDARLLVTRVVDGDTFKIESGSSEDTVRLIGVDTPETVDPRRPVQHFGKEASEFTRRLVEGKRVALRGETGGQNRDKYDRLLRYVYLEDGTLVNAEIIRQGYGHAYIKYPFSKMEEFIALERQAREQGRGLWSDEEDAEAEPGLARAPTPAPAPTEGVAPREEKPAAAAQEQTVYVTRTGSKYHQTGCRYLSKGMIPIELKEAAQRYGPCSVCRPPQPKPGAEGGS